MAKTKQTILNTHKTMLFQRKQKHIDEVSVIINGIKIELVASFNFLVIMLDENLLWKSHMEIVGNIATNNHTLQKKALRFMTNSSYLAHTTPLLIKHGLLNVGDMYKLKLLKFYYKLSYDLLPPYFNNYIEIIEQKPARDFRYQYIQALLFKRVYAECSPLFQLTKLINSLKK